MLIRILAFLLICWLDVAIAKERVCSGGQHWVEPHFRRAYYRADGTFVSATNVKGHCRANWKGYEVWHPRLKNSRPRVWGYKNETSKKWTPEEVERILEALESLPQILRDQDINGLYRMYKSVLRGNPATSNRDEIVLYDDAFDTNYNLARVIAHELAHRLYDNLTEEEKNSYFQAASWRRQKIKGKEVILPLRSRDSFVAPDGLSMPEEDFANNIEYFLFEPAELQKTTPSVHQWIQSRFGDKLKEVH